MEHRLFRIQMQTTNELTLEESLRMGCQQSYERLRAIEKTNANQTLPKEPAHICYIDTPKLIAPGQKETRYFFSGYIKQVGINPSYSATAVAAGEEQSLDALTEWLQSTTRCSTETVRQAIYSFRTEEVPVDHPDMVRTVEELKFLLTNQYSNVTTDMKSIKALNETYEHYTGIITGPVSDVLEIRQFLRQNSHSITLHGENLLFSSRCPAKGQ